MPKGSASNNVRGSRPRIGTRPMNPHLSHAGSSLGKSTTDRPDVPAEGTPAVGFEDREVAPRQQVAKSHDNGRHRAAADEGEPGSQRCRTRDAIPPGPKGGPPGTHP